MRSHRYLWVLGAALLASCYDYSVPDGVVNGAIVITQENPSFPYSTTTSYYLDPMAKVVEDDPTQPSEIALNSSLVSTIDTNMKAAGFTTKLTTLPSAGTQHTVGLKVTFLKGTVAVYYPGYWCSYWYYYSCYYSWSYAGSYNTGTMILEMGDLSAPEGGTLPIAWLSGSYGVASSSSYNYALATEGVNRSFAQSPYLYH